MVDEGRARYPDLAGRSVFISGGGSGIGAALVRAFAEQASRVTFIDIADEPSHALERQLGSGVRYVRCDVRDIEALRTAIDRAAEVFGPLRVLVNNAARDDRHAFDAVTPDYWDESLAVNLRHHFFASQAAARQMSAGGGGSIVNMGSVSWMRGREKLAAYTTSKAGIMGLTRTLARELGAANIRVNSVVPGAIATARQDALWFSPEAQRDVVAQQCLKFRLSEDDVARSVLFLASDASRAITGHSLIVDGGLAQTSVVAY
ncbi:MAG TPA: SDR family NAD(P)-dependent oxidoreductase [Casimicrobiaceae bacterium]|nr:SDR family NAD(P)-dependent oxidoreductase [Casimicrobiaceae bacterium]